MTIPRDAFESLVREHHAAVFRTAARLLPAADAEDVTQQVFTRLWQGQHQLGAEPRASLRWLAGRLALNALRRGRVSRRHEENHAMTRPEAIPAPDPVAAQAHAAVRSALGELPPDLRTAVVLRYQEGLTFDGIALALTCSESTAHDRVRRGLDKLRALLTRAGFAAAGLRLPELLGDASAPAHASQTLEQQLLALPDRALAVASATSSIWPATALLALALGATWALTSWHPTPPAAESASLGAAAPSAIERVEPPATRTPLEAMAAPQTPPPSPPSSPPSNRPTAGEPHGRILGNAFDATDGHPLADARVCAVSLARGRKGQDFRVTTRTDATGRFALEVPVSERRREAYVVWVQLDDYVQFGAVETTVVADQANELRAAMRRWATDVAGAWQLELTLRDPAGAPVADAQVDVHRRQPDGVHTGVRTEVHERTDAAGRAVLRGTHRGEKLLRVRAKARSLAQLTHTLAITEPGPHALELTLAQGRAVAGVVRAAADGSPIAGLMITAEHVPEGEQRNEEIGFVATDTEGRFRIEGCGAGPVRLSGHGEQWSRFVAEGFAPGEEQIELALKRRGDPTARGMHLGEIHGRVTDAASGRDVEISRWAVDVKLIPPEVADWRAHLLGEILNPRPVQVAMFGPRPAPSPVFWVDDLPAGRYVLVVRHPGYAPSLAGPFEVGPGRLIADVALAMAPGGTVTGTLKDANGRPIAKACVWVTAAADPTGEAREAARALAGGDRYPTYRYSQTDAEGRLRLEHLPAGVTLRCVAADGEAGIALSAPFVLENGRAHAIDLQLTR